MDKFQCDQNAPGSRDTGCGLNRRYRTALSDKEMGVIFDQVYSQQTLKAAKDYCKSLGREKSDAHTALKEYKEDRKYLTSPAKERPLTANEIRDRQSRTYEEQRVMDDQRKTKRTVNFIGIEKLKKNIEQATTKQLGEDNRINFAEFCAQKLKDRGHWRTQVARFSSSNPH